MHTRSQKEHPGPVYDISENPQDANKVYKFYFVGEHYLHTGSMVQQVLVSFKQLCLTCMFPYLVIAWL